MTTTHPSLIVESPLSDGDLWIECRTCGRASYLSKGPIGHKRGCSTSAQYSASVAASETTPTPDQLRSFGASVRRSGLTKGRDADVLEAVRSGCLSESDAMNTDD